MDQTTKIQDCNQILAAFERGAHFNSDEASVYAPLTRHLQNIRSAARSSKQIVQNYKTQPVAPIQSSDPVPGQTGLLINNQYINIPSGKTSTDVLSRALKECVPCAQRPLLGLDLNVGSQLLNALKADVQRRLSVLDSIKSMFTNLNVYSDYCQMLSFLNSMCVPDLQRMALLLASMLTDYGSGLGNLTAMLQALIAPFFYPVLISINGMLDKLVQLVLNPMNCIITSIQQVITKLNVGSVINNQTLTNQQKNLSSTGQEVNIDIKQLEGVAKSGLIDLYQKLNEGNATLRKKLDFYTRQLDKLLKQWSGHNTSYISTANNKLLVIRLIGFVRAMINAKQSNFVCNGQQPTTNEINTFFTKFLAPNTNFNITVDKDGNLQVQEKINSPVTITVGISAPLLKSPIIPVSQIFKCKLNTSSQDIDKVNQWMSQLDSI